MVFSEITADPALLGAGGALAAAIVELYRRTIAAHTRISIKLDEAEKLIREQAVRETEITARMARLEGEHEGVRGLAAEVLRTIAEAADAKKTVPPITGKSVTQ